LALQDELNEIVSQAEESDDLEQLTQFQKRSEAILANASKTLATERDAVQREHLQQIEEQAKETLRTVKQRLAEVKIARLDPEYEQRKAEKARAEQLKKQKEMEQAQQFLSQGGLGGLLGSIFGAAAGVAWVSGGRSSARTRFDLADFQIESADCQDNEDQGDAQAFAPHVALAQGYHARLVGLLGYIHTLLSELPNFRLIKAVHIDARLDQRLMRVGQFDFGT